MMKHITSESPCKMAPASVGSLAHRLQQCGAAFVALLLAAALSFGLAGCANAPSAARGSSSYSGSNGSSSYSYTDATAVAQENASAVGVEVGTGNGTAETGALAEAFASDGQGYEVLAEGVAEPAVVEQHGNEPSFTEEEIDYAATHLGYEDYSELDSLGRCGAATACLGPETIPAEGEERGDISSVKPTGWDQAFYDTVDGEALWNRCHLIGWQLSEENANEQNLVTGTRSMNVDGMLPYEDEVAYYIDATGNHVLYRVTPLFVEAELVCRAVLIEAESIEDDGTGVSFAVLCLNVQPGIGINYTTGASHAEGGSGDADVQQFVLNTSSMRFHYPDCSAVKNMSEKNREYVEASHDELVAQGYKPCGECRP